MERKEIAKFVSRLLNNGVRLHYSHVLEKTMEECKVSEIVAREVLDQLELEGLIFSPRRDQLEGVW